MGNLGIVDARRSIDGIDQSTQAATEYDSECAIGDIHALAYERNRLVDVLLRDDVLHGTSRTK